MEEKRVLLVCEHDDFRWLNRSIIEAGYRAGIKVVLTYRETQTEAIDELRFNNASYDALACGDSLRQNRWDVPTALHARQLQELMKEVTGRRCYEVGANTGGVQNLIRSIMPLFDGVYEGTVYVFWHDGIKIVALPDGDGMKFMHDRLVVQGTVVVAGKRVRIKTNTGHTFASSSASVRQIEVRTH